MQLLVPPAGIVTRRKLALGALLFVKVPWRLRDLIAVPWSFTHRFDTKSLSVLHDVQDLISNLLALVASWRSIAPEPCVPLASSDCCKRPSCP